MREHVQKYGYIKTMFSEKFKYFNLVGDKSTNENLKIRHQ